MPVGDEGPPAACREHGILPGVQIETGVALVGVGREREIGVELNDGNRERHGPDRRRSPGASSADRVVTRAKRTGNISVLRSDRCSG